MRACTKVLLSATIVALLSPATFAQHDAPVAPKAYRTDDWAIAAPSDWGTFDQISPPLALLLVGDGRQGVPTMDGALSVLKAGISIERFPTPPISIKQMIEADLRELTESGRFQVVKGPDVSEITLSDGVRAALVKAEFVRLEDGRLTINQKVYCVDAKGNHIIATGFITCSRPGAGFVRAIKLADFLQPHVTSLVLDPAKLNVEPLGAAYENHDWKISTVIATTRQANQLLEQKKYPQAVGLFRVAIRNCPSVSAAHNGLAWALLQSSDAPASELQQALIAARKAVELTEELDYATLDTLAHACHRNGQKRDALKAIYRALSFQPDHPELKATLQLIEKGQ
jgi:tetratricopeptide (TPR) repeat protein